LNETATEHRSKNHWTKEYLLLLYTNDRLLSKAPFYSDLEDVLCIKKYHKKCSNYQSYLLLLVFYVNKYMEVRHSFSMICFGGIYFQGHCSTNKMVYFQIYIIIVWIKILYFHLKKMPIISPTMYMNIIFISTSNFHYFLKHEFLLNFGTYTFFPVMEKE